MSAAIYNFTIEQGATLIKNFTYTDNDDVPINLTGYSARMQCRANVSSAATIFNLSTATTGLTIPTPSNGTIVMTLSASATSALQVGGVYDLEIESAGGVVTRLLQGTISLSSEITR